MPAVKARDW